jgi:hypothetical protein
LPCSAGVAFTPGLKAGAPCESQVATLLYEDGGGVWTCEAADHMVVNQPSTVIRDCDADLKMLDAHLAYYGPGDDESFPVPVLSILAEAYGITQDQP